MSGLPSRAAAAAAADPRDCVLIRERDVGLFSLFLQVVNVLQALEGTRRIPLALFGDGCAYFHPDGHRGRRTVWEYYFEPLDRRLPEAAVLDLRPPERAAFESAAVVTRDYYPEFAPVDPRLRIPFLTEVALAHRLAGARLISRFVRLRRYLEERVAEFHRRHLAERYVIGLHFRGTDAIGSHLREREIDVGDHLEAAERQAAAARARGVDRIAFFAAADDQKYIDAARRHFGDRLVETGALRSDGEPAAGAGPTGDLMPGYVSRSPDAAVRNGEEVVMEYRLLCAGHFLVHNISSVSRAVLVTRPFLAHHNVQPYR